MANLQEVRDRIGSVITTQQITKAMKLVSASKLKRAQDRIVQMRPYSDKLYGILKNIMANIDVEDLNLNFSKVRPIENVLIVLITSDKGLCGGFNANLVKKAKALIQDKYADLAQKGNITLLPVGKKGMDAFKYNEELVMNNDSVELFQKLSFTDSSELTQYIMDSFNNGTYDKVHVIYSQFKNAATQEFTDDEFLPITALASDEEESTVASDFIFEPNKKKLVKELIPKILKTEFYRFLLDSNASEHGARMVAMDQATENANELLGELKLQYNRERQAAITNEILEIVGGAAALEEG